MKAAVARAALQGINRYFLDVLTREKQPELVLALTVEWRVAVHSLAEVLPIPPADILKAEEMILKHRRKQLEPSVDKDK